MSKIQFSSSIFEKFTPVLPLAKKVSGLVEIDILRIVESSMRREFSIDKLPEQLDFNVNSETDVVDQVIEVFVTYNLEAKKEDESSSVEVFAKYQILYSLEDTDGLTTEDFEAFGLLNGVYNSWPYWREFVQSSFARMTLPSFTFPVFNPLQLEGHVNESADEFDDDRDEDVDDECDEESSDS